MKITPLTKLCWFQYRLLSGKVVTNNFRAKWDSNTTKLCYYCHSEVETINHLLLECRVIAKLWANLTKWLEYMLGCTIQLTEEIIILNNFSSQFNETINIMILIAKQYIFMLPSAWVKMLH